MIPKRITKSYIAICEGNADEETFKVLVRKRRIRNIEFVCPDASCGGYGKSYFYGVLSALTILRGFDNLKGIIFIQDSDSNPNVALRELQQQLRKANRGFEPEERFTIPVNLLTPSFSANRPPILFLTIPWIDTLGALESLILPSLEAAFPEITDCLNDYCDCTQNVNGWSASKQSKMRLASMVAAICRKDPTSAIQNMWNKDEFRNLMENECFDQLADFFRNKSQFFTRP